VDKVFLMKGNLVDLCGCTVGVSIVYIPATHAGGVPISERGFAAIVVYFPGS